MYQPFPTLSEDVPDPFHVTMRESYTTWSRNSTSKRDPTPLTWIQIQRDLTADQVLTLYCRLKTVPVYAAYPTRVCNENWISKVTQS